MDNIIFKPMPTSDSELAYYNHLFQCQRSLTNNVSCVFENNVGNEFWASWGYCSVFRFYALSNDYNPQNRKLTKKMLESNLINKQNFTRGENYVSQRICNGIQNDPYLNYIFSREYINIFNQSIFGDPFLKYIENKIAEFINLIEYEKPLYIDSGGICRLNRDAIQNKHIVIFRGALFQTEEFFETCRKIIKLGGSSVTGLFLTRAVPTPESIY